MEPCVVITNSCSAIPPDLVIKSILGVDELDEPLLVLPEVRSYPWHIDTKYYHANVNLCALEKKTIGTEDFADAVNAIIIPFDSTCCDSLNSTEQWLAFTEKWDAEIKILLCNNCKSDESDKEQAAKVSKLEAQNWCVKNGFELVELSPIAVEEDSDVEDDFPETTGIKRVIQALHAHIWPNLNMKGCNNKLDAGENVPQTPFMGPLELMGLQHILNGVPRSAENFAPAEVKANGESAHTSDARKKLVAEVKPLPKEPVKTTASNVAIVSPMVLPTSFPIGSESGGGPSNENTSTVSHSIPDPSTKPSPTRDDRIDAMLQAMDSMPEESFEELYHSLNEIKSKAESLSPTQRKVYAEKMAVAFWKSIGGNDSEVDGLSSDDED